MHIVLWIVLAAFLLVNICCTACFLYGYLLRPYTVFGTCVVVWGTGNGEGLEQRVRALLWLQNCGLLRCKVVLVDGGLDRSGMELAVRLIGRYPALALCNRRELARHLNET